MLGVLTVIAVLVLVVGYVVWRRLMRRHQTTSDETPAADTDPDAVREQMRADYEAKVAAHDPDTLEASRDWHDNLGSSWRVEVGMAFYLVMLFGSLLVLIPLFLLLKALAN